MIWLQFLISAVLIVLAANQLARYGDIIAVRTRLGGMFIGLLLLAGATSLPELLTTINSIQIGEANLAAGNLLGSNMFNMFLLALLSVVAYKRRILREAILKHALSGSLTVLLITLVVFLVLADIDVKIGWVGLDSLAIIAAYVGVVYLIQSESGGSGVEEAIPPGTPSLRRGLIGFALAAGALVVITPFMVRASAVIAETTGLGTTFVGTTLVALVTSLPELVTTLAAARIGAEDMAIGNLFGSNLFNMFALGLADLFYTQGRFIGEIDAQFVLIGILGLLMTVLALVGNLARFRRRLMFLEIDALALILVYFGGLWLLYSRGMG